ncbi:hypothetical protein EQG41_04505 [Billgrantia azerbaijanica]|nr:hypothetical protein EQG41_04505 [Halomonas azerbaijanica]
MAIIKNIEVAEKSARRRAASLSSIVTFLLALAISLSPLYFFPSGGPQLTDFAFVVFSSVVALAAVSNKIYLEKRDKRLLVLFILLCLWVLVVSSVNTIYFSMTEILFPSLFYIYNTIVAVMVFMFLKESPSAGARAIKIGAVLSTVIVLVFWFSDLTASTRRVDGSFNNPNQLAYYSLVIISILLCVLNNKELLKPVYLCVIGVLVVYTLSSSSLTAVVALFISLFGVLCKVSGTLRSALTRGVSLLAIIVVAGSVFMMTEKGNTVVNMVEARFLLLDDKLEDVGESRGYSRILEYPEYIFFGAGERGRDRFGYGHSHEIHSTFGTLLFSYGIVGVVLFMMLLVSTIREGGFYHFFALAAPLFYAITHNGLRFTLFWILLVVIFMSIKECRKISNS